MTDWFWTTQIFNEEIYIFIFNVPIRFCDCGRQVLQALECKCIYACFICVYMHYGDVIMEAIASQITSLASVYSTVQLGAVQRKHQSSASLAFVWGIHRGPVNSPHKWPVTRKMFPFDDVFMGQGQTCVSYLRRQMWIWIVNTLRYFSLYHVILSFVYDRFCCIYCTVCLKQVGNWLQ